MSFFINKDHREKQSIFPGVDIRTTAGKHIQLSYIEFEPHSIVEAHSHPHEQAGMVLEGRARFIVGDEEHILGPGDMYVIPGNVIHRVVALDQPFKALDVFHPPREEYL